MLNIIKLSGKEFFFMKKFMEDLTGLTLPDGNHAFTAICDKKYVIFINNDSDLPGDARQIIIQHERAHSLGIVDEEEADRYALARLSKKQQRFLIDQWEHRHGHKYKKIP